MRQDVKITGSVLAAVVVPCCVSAALLAESIPAAIGVPGIEPVAVGMLRTYRKPHQSLILYWQLCGQAPVGAAGVGDSGVSKVVTSSKLCSREGICDSCWGRRIFLGSAARSAEKDSEWSASG